MNPTGLSPNRSCASGHPPFAADTNADMRLVGLRVLIAVGEALNQKLLLEMLTGLGAGTALALSGREIVTMVVGAKGKPFDMVLIDLPMLDMGGIEATKVLRERHHLTDLPFIAMSVGVEPEYRERCLAAGLTDVISGPINTAELIRLVELHCHCRRSSNSLPDDLPAPALNLPVIPGISLTDALDRLDNNVTFYARLVNRFLGGLADSRQQLVAQLGEVSSEGTRKAVQKLHSFRGGALTLGASDLANLIGQLEMTLTENATSDRPPMQADLVAALARAQTELQDVVSCLNANLLIAKRTGKD